MKNRNNLTIILVTLIVAVTGITVAYSVLSENLTITFGTSTSSSITQKGATWNIHFDTTTSSVAGTASGYSGVTCGNATVTTSGVTITSATLYAPGDSCTWQLRVRNEGSLNAKLSAITWTQPTGASCTSSTNGKYVCGNVTYTLIGINNDTNTATDGVLERNTQLWGNGMLPLTLKVEYTGSTLATSDIKHYNGKVQLNWVQD